MRIISKAILSVLALAATAALLVAQGPPLERQEPSEDPPWIRQMGPRFGHRAHFRFDGGMGAEPWMREHAPHGLAGLVSDPRVRERLGITPEQASKIRQQELNFRKVQIRNRAELEVKWIELTELLAADKPDRAVIDKKLREISDTRFASEKSRIDHRLAMQEALTPEQREKLKQMFSEFRRPFAERGPSGYGPGGRQGPRGPRPPDAQPVPPSQKPGSLNEPAARRPGPS